MSLARYVAVTAPGGLALAQGLLNTRETASGATDLLVDDETAQAWLAPALAEWGELTGSAVPRTPGVSASAAELRELRARVRDYISGERFAINVLISIASTDDGELRTQPTGAGIDWVASAVWGGILVAQQADRLRRLKICRNEVCGSAFYDRSKNNSGVWHDVHVCGNAANLRASRARRRAAPVTHVT
jgi:predicted RNA-binding Zn ribbon-like protein